eukprot:Awhi_evm1s13474
MKLAMGTLYLGIVPVLLSIFDFGDAKCEPVVENESGKELELQFFDGKDNSYLIPYSDKKVANGDNITGKCDSNGKDRCHVLTFYYIDGSIYQCSGHIDMKCEDTYKFTDVCTYSK